MTVMSYPHTGDPEWDHLLDEIDHPEVVEADLKHTKEPHYGELRPTSSEEVQDAVQQGDRPV